MPLLVRKIEANKWRTPHAAGGGMPSADAITKCMKTSGNALSLWAIEDDAELNEAILAIAGGMETLETIDVVWFDACAFGKRGLPVVEAPETGRTAYEGFRYRHRDVVNLDYWSLGTMAEMVAEAIREDRCKRIIRGDLKRMMKAALVEGKIKWWDLPKSMRRHTDCPIHLICEAYALCMARDKFDEWRGSLTEGVQPELITDAREFTVVYRREPSQWPLCSVAIDLASGDASTIAACQLSPI
jgi:hypothetical protein